MVGVDGGSVEIYPRFCKRWACVRCNPRKVRDTEARITAGIELGSTWLVTLTFAGTVTADDTYTLLQPALKRYRERLRRAGPYECVAVFEPQRRGAAHVHMLVRGPKLTNAWVARTALETGFGRANVIPARLDHAPYLVKFLRAELTSALPAFTRRVQWSRGWAPRPVQGASQEIPAPRPPRSWWVTNASPTATAESAAARGYRVEVVVVERRSWWPRWGVVRWFPAGAISRAWSILPRPAALVR